MAEDWSEAEVALIVEDYFDMLRSELLGNPFNKTYHRERLAPKLNGRSKGSIERKHQNISAVLVKMGLPYIDGYKPMGNFQVLLATSVEDYIDRNPAYFGEVAQSSRLNPVEFPELAVPTVEDFFVPPPEQLIVPLPTSKPWLSRRGQKIDFARRDAENRRMAKLGEEFVVEIEKQRLRGAGREDLAAKVAWIAQTCGDGVGFDILSFNKQDEREKFVEVKATGLGKLFPFYVTANELRCSEDVPDRFHLYRLFNFSSEARIDELVGALSQTCKLDPVQYRASI